MSSNSTLFISLMPLSGSCSNVHLQGFLSSPVGPCHRCSQGPPPPGSHCYRTLTPALLT